ncbi:MAG TPA: hypothetical protein PLJ34_06090, partial [Hyphomicrobiales bacterium]|nr:hypothetical protein [Hyphomicrobiales bacterium]
MTGQTPAQRHRGLSLGRKDPENETSFAQRGFASPQQRTTDQDAELKKQGLGLALFFALARSPARPIASR